MSRARQRRERVATGKSMAAARRARNRERTAKDREIKDRLGQCRHCKLPVKVSQGGKKFRMCQLHLDMDAARKAKS